MEFRESVNAVETCLKELQENHHDVVLYGAGYCGHEALSLMAAHNIPVRAVCDDFRVGEKLDGYPILRMKDVPIAPQTVIFITSGFNAKMKERLKALGLFSHYREMDFGRYDGEKENAAYFKAHVKELTEAWALLSDERSCANLQNLVNYRISRDLRYLAGMEEANQYFPPKDDFSVSWGGRDVFLDLGAYDGDSLRAFIKYVGGRYQKIIAIEASRKNYERLLENTRELANVHCIHIGIYKEQAQLSFEINDAKNSFASEAGTALINVDSVDHILAGEKVTTVKMDIEGAEYDALLGMKDTLKAHPILMVSMYHKVEDLFRLQLLIEKMCPGVYHYYIRHYSPTIIETVLYAVPKEREAMRHTGGRKNHAARDKREIEGWNKKNSAE